MIKVLVCDDDSFVAEKVKGFIDEIKNNYNFGLNITVTTDAKAQSEKNEMYDIAVLDIDMPDVNGLELAEKLKEVNPDVVVIMLTSFSEYLDSAMRISVFRFLSKPVDKERFVRNFIEAVEAYKAISKTIIVEKSDGVYVIRTKDILYIETARFGSVIVTKKAHIKTKRKPVEWYELMGCPAFFASPHSSYFVNLQNVVSFDKHSVTFDGKDGYMKVECVAQRRYTEFKKDFFRFVGGV